MTQKELLYFEDAIGHLGNIDKLLNDFIGKVNNNQIKDFFSSQQTKIKSLKSNLTSVVGGKANG